MAFSRTTGFGGFEVDSIDPDQLVWYAVGICGSQYHIAETDRRRLKGAFTLRYDFRKASRSALMISACVVGMPCGKSL